MPLLVNGLVHSDLPISEIALFDLDADRLRLIAGLASRFTGSARLRVSTELGEAIEGADFVFISIRVGGIRGRARDEAIALAHGLIGQETVGPGGFAMALRTIPVLVGYAEEIARRAPKAWIINFTNPVGIITQAVRQATGARIIGICDTPTELFEDVAHALDVPSIECHFDYFGLNHLGWLREVFHRGEPQLARLWGRADLLENIYRAPLFEVERLQALRLLPTEYVYYYYRAAQAFENISRAGESRGLVIERPDAARDLPVRVKDYERRTVNAGLTQSRSDAVDALACNPLIASRAQVAELVDALIPA